MATKIIKEGTLKKINCNECGCLFSYEAEDIETKENTVFASNGYKEIVICPQCKSEVVLAQTK